MNGFPSHIGISVSNAGDLEAQGLTVHGQVKLMADFAKHFQARGATLYYGGDYRANGYTQILSMASVGTSYQNQFINYTPFPGYLGKPGFELRPAYEKKIVPSSVKGKSEDLDHRIIESLVLSRMRKLMQKKIDARLVVGGSIRDFRGKYPGVLEEAWLALRNDKPVYMIGAFGGIAQAIIHALQGKKSTVISGEFQLRDLKYAGFVEVFNKACDPRFIIDYRRIVKFITAYSLERLSGNNGLSVMENQRLFDTTNTDEMIYLVMKGLTKIGSTAS